jgi:hypothetical protein
MFWPNSVLAYSELVKAFPVFMEPEPSLSCSPNENSDMDVYTTWNSVT